MEIVFKRSRLKLRFLKIQVYFKMIRTFVESSGISATESTGIRPCAGRDYRCEIYWTVVLGSQGETGHELHTAGCNELK